MCRHFQPFNSGALKVLGIALLMIYSSGILARVGSQAELWGQRTSVEKAAYLQGFCEGVAVFSIAAKSNLDDIFCINPAEFGKSTAQRFCGLVWSENQNSARRYLDEFYRAKNHSDIPLWAAVMAYNDKACKENTVRGKLEGMQKRFLCSRQYGNMMEAGVSAPVLQKQKEECDKYER